MVDFDSALTSNQLGAGDAGDAPIWFWFALVMGLACCCFCLMLPVLFARMRKHKKQKNTENPGKKQSFFQMYKEGIKEEFSQLHKLEHKAEHLVHEAHLAEEHTMGHLTEHLHHGHAAVPLSIMIGNHNRFFYWFSQENENFREIAIEAGTYTSMDELAKAIKEGLKKQFVYPDCQYDTSHGRLGRFAIDTGSKMHEVHNGAGKKKEHHHHVDEEGFFVCFHNYGKEEALDAGCLNPEDAGLDLPVLDGGDKISKTGLNQDTHKVLGAIPSMHIGSEKCTDMLINAFGSTLGDNDTHYSVLTPQALKLKAPPPAAASAAAVAAANLFTPAAPPATKAPPATAFSKTEGLSIGIHFENTPKDGLARVSKRERMAKKMKEGGEAWRLEGLKLEP